MKRGKFREKGIQKGKKLKMTKKKKKTSDFLKYRYKYIYRRNNLLLWIKSTKKSYIKYEIIKVALELYNKMTS